MKGLLSVVLSGVVLVSLVQAPEAKASNIAQNMCDYVAANDKNRMRSFLKTNRMKIRSIFSGIQCNGKNLVAFASDANANETGEFIINKLPKNDVQEILATITSPGLKAAAEKRING